MVEAWREATTTGVRFPCHPAGFHGATPSAMPLLAIVSIAAGIRGPNEKGLTRVASIQTLERRIAALEARLADVEGRYGETLYHLRRAAIKSGLRLGKILEHLQIDDITR